MDNDIDPAIGRWYQRVRDGRLFQVVAVDDDEELVEWQDFDGGIGEVSLDEFRSWDVEVTAAPEDWTGPLDEVRRGDLDYSEIRSEGEERGFDAERRAEALQDNDVPNRRRRNRPVSRRAERAGESGRADGLGRDAINEVKARLTERAGELRLDIQRELRKYDDENYTELAQRVADSGEQAWSDLVSDLNLAEVTRDVHELRNVDTALQRLAQGYYGICVSCGDRIDAERLDANPAAVRCLECQQDAEDHARQSGGPGHPSL